MPEFIISKSPALRGEVEISGSKNSALPILCAALLTEEECVISKVPPLRDVYVMLEIIKALGAKVDYDETTHTAKICANKITSTDEDYALAEKLRASFLVMGPLLARKHKAKIPMPGGCQIGTRPIDLHLKGLGEMGVKIKQEHGYVTAKCNELIGGKICLDFPSVGATENLLMAACLAKGETIIENAATEPEIVDLAEFLNKMGAKISDFGKGTITVMGVERLAGVKHTIIPDRIEAGTFMAAAVITGGDILIKNAKSDHLGAIISKLKEA
ncbi:MAG: UDP-N-acetylglucosamine 1-carboxyvinyltransferase, partial [Anaerotignaceae bacterium]